MPKVMNVQKNIQLSGSAGRPFLLDVYAPDAGPHHPLVVFVHGFKGYKDYGCWELVAREFVEAGFAFIKFNFSHNGTTLQNPLAFDDLEAFGNNNFSRELDDLGTVLDGALSGEQLHTFSIDPAQVNLIGHSRGGATALLKAHEDERVKRVVSWAGVGSLDNYIRADDVDRWREKGVVYVENSRTKQQMPLYFQLYEDFVAHTDRLDLDGALRGLNQPYLVVHGTADPVVPYSAALHLYENSPNSELETIIGADHGFGGTNPWPGAELPDDLALVVKKTAAYLGRR